MFSTVEQFRSQEWMAECGNADSASRSWNSPCCLPLLHIRHRGSAVLPVEGKANSGLFCWLQLLERRSLLCRANVQPTCHKVGTLSRKLQPRIGQPAGQLAGGHASSGQGPDCPALPLPCLQLGIVLIIFYSFQRAPEWEAFTHAMQ